MFKDIIVPSERVASAAIERFDAAARRSLVVGGAARDQDNRVGSAGDKAAASARAGSAAHATRTYFVSGSWAASSKSDSEFRISTAGSSYPLRLL
jgi:hypothetical protein